LSLAHEQFLLLAQSPSQSQPEQSDGILMPFEIFRDLMYAKPIATVVNREQFSHYKVDYKENWNMVLIEAN
jgi:hypothetical protein